MHSIFTNLGLMLVLCVGLSWLALVFKQPVIIAYILCGVLAGPGVLSIVTNVEFAEQAAHIGITLLLFLAGLELQPKRFFKDLKALLPTTLVAFLFNTAIVFIVCYFLKFSLKESLLIGLALMFSSTLLVVKMLPMKTLEEKHMGGFCLAILIVEDLIAVMILMFLGTEGGALASVWDWILLPVKGAALVLGAFLVEQFVLRRVMTHLTSLFEETQLMTGLGWCLALALIAAKMGFTHEVGAFVAGISIARGPMATKMAHGLHFLRDFFLLMFFFILGYELDVMASKKYLIIAPIMSIFIILSKSYFYQYLFRRKGETPRFSKEASVRLGQSSEFGLIIAIVALQTGSLGREASQFIQLTVIFSLILSSYRVFYFYPNSLRVKKSVKTPWPYLGPPTEQQ